QRESIDMPALHSVLLLLCRIFLFFFTDPATTEIYTLSLHDALPILSDSHAFREALDALGVRRPSSGTLGAAVTTSRFETDAMVRSEEHTSELQSLRHLVCRLLLEKKKKKKKNTHNTTNKSNYLKSAY